MIWIAFAAHMVVYGAIGLAVVLAGRSILPKPWNEPSTMIPLIAALGMLLIIATLPHWGLLRG